MKNLLASSPPRLLASSPPRLLASSPPRLLASSPPRLLALLLLIGCAACISPSDEAPPPPRPVVEGIDETPSDAVVHYMGHGGFFGEQGGGLLPNLSIIANTQRYQLKRLSSEPGASSVEAPTTQEIADEVLRRAAHIDRLLENPAAAHHQFAKFGPVNSSLRAYYIRHYLSQGHPAAQTFSQPLATTAKGGDYRGQCDREGVPVPAFVPTGPRLEGWTRWGFLKTDYVLIPDLTTGGKLPTIPELWSYQDKAGKGICLALPRWQQKGTPQDLRDDDSAAYGLICHGYKSGKTCFFDNVEFDYYERGEEIPISRLIGGADLENAAGGECTDCHAGHNPFVIHPEDRAFAALIASKKLGSSSSYDPIVAGTWYQNDQFIRTLGPVRKVNNVEPLRCDNCHTAGSNAFPDVTNGELTGYCGTVLRRAFSGVLFGVFPNRPSIDPTIFMERTMPPLSSLIPPSTINEHRARYAQHADWLDRACLSTPGQGFVTEDVPPEEPDFLSRPYLDSPIYACSSVVGVRGVRIGAEVVLQGAPGGPQVETADGPGGVVFNLPMPLVGGETLTAYQVLDGARSDPSGPVEVGNPNTDFPNGLPAPSINPSELYVCASRIPVSGHVPGAQLHIRINNGTPLVAGGGPTGWTLPLPLPRELISTDNVSVKQTLCGLMSPWSVPYPVAPAPASLPMLRFDPPRMTEGQKFVHVTNVTQGSKLDLTRPANARSSTVDSWPFFMVGDYRMAQELGGRAVTGEVLQGQQRLCPNSPPSPVGSTLPTLSCGDMPAPRIAVPTPGDQFVLPLRPESIPGAMIRVYDADREIGDGTGEVIMLDRELVAGEVLLVTQSLEGCEARRAYSIVVGSSAGPGEDQ